MNAKDPGQPGFFVARFFAAAFFRMLPWPEVHSAGSTYSPASPAEDPAMKPFRIRLHGLVLLALVLAVPAGFLTSPDMVWHGIRPFAVYDFLGSLFLRALKMLVVPLIVSAVIGAVAEARSGIGGLGARAMAYFVCSSFLAVLTGLLFVNLLHPGIVDGAPAKDLVGLSASGAEVAVSVSGHTGSDLWGLFLRLIPENVVMAAAQMDMLALITFAVLYGLFVSRLSAGLRDAQLGFWRGVNEIMTAMTRAVMLFAPLGVFGLVARSLSLAGFSALGPLMTFCLTVVLALAFHQFVTLSALLYFVGRVNPWRHFRAMGEALVMAFTTSSSNATLPKTLECLEKKAGVPRQVSGFVTPLGATINMDGTALYECVAALFIAQCYGLELTLGVQFTVVLVALVSSTGVAGIPSASLVAISMILASVGLPAEGLGLILAVDRLLDMLRTQVNVYSDSCASAIMVRFFKPALV
jgi:proton glutamate symport protein